MSRFDVDMLDEEWPFEIDGQLGHLFKHPYLGVEDIQEVWASDPLFYPAIPPAHWLMVAEVSVSSTSGTTGAFQQQEPQCMPADRVLCRFPRPRKRVQERQARKMSMSPEQEREFYEDPKNQVPQGPPVRRKATLSEPVPVRFPEELLKRVRHEAAADDRSVSNWIRRAVENELSRKAG